MREHEEIRASVYSAQHGVDSICSWISRKCPVIYVIIVPQTLGATSSLGIPDDEVEQLLTAIDSIPDEVLAEGDEATAE